MGRSRDVSVGFGLSARSTMQLKQKRQCVGKSTDYVVREGKRRRVRVSLSKMLGGYRGENLYPMLQSISSFGLGQGKRGHGLRWRGQNYFGQGSATTATFSRNSNERNEISPLVRALYADLGSLLHCRGKRIKLSNCFEFNKWDELIHQYHCVPYLPQHPISISHQIVIEKGSLVSPSC